MKPFPSPFVIVSAAQGKTYPHSVKKFLSCRDGSTSVATKNIEQRQKSISIWLNIFRLYLPHTDNFVSQTFSRLARTALPKLLLSKALSISIRHNSRHAGRKLSPFRQKVLVMQRRIYLCRNKKCQTDAGTYLYLAWHFPVVPFRHSTAASHKVDFESY